MLWINVRKVPLPQCIRKWYRFRWLHWLKDIFIVPFIFQNEFESFKVRQMTKSNARKAKIFIFRVRLVMLTNAMGLDKLIQVQIGQYKEMRSQFGCINQRDLVYTILQVISILFVALNEWWIPQCICACAHTRQTHLL